MRSKLKAIHHTDKTRKKMCNLTYLQLQWNETILPQLLFFAALLLFLSETVANVLHCWIAEHMIHLKNKRDDDKSVLPSAQLIYRRLSHLYSHSIVTCSIQARKGAKLSYSKDNNTICTSNACMRTYLNVNVRELFRNVVE